MASKVTTQTVKAFLNGDRLSMGNTQVQQNPPELLLHGNLIAQKSKEGVIKFSFAGWQTPTTKERINGLLDALNLPRCYQKNHCLFWGEVEISARDWHEASREYYNELKQLTR